MSQQASGVSLALDFDGVLCNSVRELALSGWRAARLLWRDWGGAETPPRVWLDRFSEVRPVLETGYQSILLLWLLARVVSPAELLDDGEAHLARALDGCGVGRGDLMSAFADARDSWIRDDLTGWLDCHRFYPGIPESLRRLQAWDGEWAIVTTKQERFVHALLSGIGLEVAPDRVLGLDRGLPKARMLRGLAHRDRRLVFVEDRLATLREVAAADWGRPLSLLLALWGYVTPSDRARAASGDWVRSIELEEFVGLVRAWTAPESRGVR
jgi:phosphoglycolate phosphatase-like HAD superfamily hydrolase